MIFGNKIKSNVAVFIAPENFRDEEYFDTVDELEKSKANIITVSNKLGLCKGKLGGSAVSELKLEDIDIEDFDAFIFIGGSGANVFKGNELVNRILNKATAEGKVIGAICIAPMILNDAGILKGRRVTVWDDEEKTNQNKLMLNGVEVLNQDVVVDTNFVTANGPKATRKFAQEIAKVIDKFL